MLYAIVFLSGAVLMSLEMIGSRLLAPTFGTSIYVWGSLITVVMAALTLGYFLGGRLADRRPSLRAMGKILAVAGLLTGFLPFWTAPVNRQLADLGPRTGSLLAAVAFFFLPSVLMATISPYGIKLAGRSLTTIGHTAGRMSALSSAGSILGTLVTSFFLIPVMGIRNIVHTLGLILLVLAALVFLLSFLGRAGLRDDGAQDGKPQAGPLVLALFCLAMTVLLALSVWIRPPVARLHGPISSKVLYARDTLYHQIVVDEVGGERHLHFDRSWQSAIYVDDPLRDVFSYTSYLHLGAVAVPKPRRMLVIGLGGGTAPRIFLHDYPSLESIDAVEIDPEVAAIARRFFMMPDDPRLHVIVQDGRLFVEKMARLVSAGQADPYDLVVIDAYFADAIPYHLTTREFLLALRQVVSADGVVVSNIIGSFACRQSRLLRSMSRTIADVFAQVYTFPVNSWYNQFDAETLRNIIVIATQTDKRWSRQKWLNQAESLHASGAIREDVAALAKYMVVDPTLLKLTRADDIPILTDDFAPVDTLQSPY